MDECVGVSSWVDGGLGVWKCPCMTACTCTQIHTHVKHGKHDTHEAGHFSISIHVSFNIYVHAVHVGTPHPQTWGAQITKNAISLEQIQIIQFCLKICDL